jgi:hypothetical protein
MPIIFEEGLNILVRKDKLKDLLASGLISLKMLYSL